MKRKHTEKWFAVVIVTKTPERPLNEQERLAVAMGFIQCAFATAEKWFAVRERKRISGAEFGRLWNAASAECDNYSKHNPGAMAWIEERYSDTPFLTGQTL